MATWDDRRDRDIWIGDVLDVWRTLALGTPEARAAAAEALGFDASMLRPAVEESRPTNDQTASRAPVEHTEDTDTPRVPVAVASRIIPSIIEEDVRGDDDRDEDVPSWVTHARPLAQEDAAHATWRPSHVPLLKAHWVRHLLTAVAAVPVEEGTLDEPRLIDAVCRLRPVKRWPRRPRPTLRKGVQVLVDVGEAMQPFHRDVQEVVAELRTVVGREQLVSAAFDYTPLTRDIIWLRPRRRGPWLPPMAGTPILVISDLGISQHYANTRGAAVSEWLEFAARCRAAGCTAVALIPRAAADWPDALQKVFTMVPWDRRTNVSVVLRFLRSSGRRQ